MNEMQQLQRYALRQMPELLEQGSDGVSAVVDALVRAQRILSDESRGLALLFYATPALETIECLAEILVTEARRHGYDLPSPDFSRD